MKQLFTSFRLFLFMILLGSAIFSTYGQTTLTVDPRNYSLANPYTFPNYPDRTTVYFIIKTGKPIYITFTGVVSGYQLVRDQDGRSSYPIQNNVELTNPGTWNFEYKYNGTTVKATTLQVSYQADLQDQTIGSATFGDYPDFIWVTQGGSATVNEGKYFNDGYYGWQFMNESWISQGYTDSIKAFSYGSYISLTSDNKGNISKDTVSILERPTFNSTAKTLNFPTTTTGIIYKLLKVGSISGTDTIWTEAQNFVGDGNLKSLSLADGKHRLTTTFGIHTSVYPYGYFVVGLTTALDKTIEENINYRLVDNKLQFDNEVNLKFYSLQGQLIQQEQGSSFKLCRQVGIFKATDKNGNVLTAKIILK